MVCSSLLFFPIIILAGSYLLYWNERGVIIQRKALGEGSKVVIGHDDTAEINDDLDGELIHFSGKATTDYLVYDTIFGVGLDDDFLKVRRTVEMYQWVEELKEGEKEYSLEWKPYVVNSNRFRKKTLKNPSTMPYKGTTFVGADIEVDAFLLSKEVVDKMDWFKPYPNVEKSSILDASTSSKATLYENMFYFGIGSPDPENPIVGDTRVGFEFIPSEVISVVAKQTPTGLSAYTSKSGGTVLLVEPGNLNEDEIFDKANWELSLQAWFFRFIGWVIVWIGFWLWMKPLAKSIPFVKGLSVGLATLTACMAIAVAWVIYRPLISGIIMLVVVLLGVGLWFALKRTFGKKKQQEVQVVCEVPDAPDKGVSEVPDVTDTVASENSDAHDTVPKSKVMEEP